MLRYMSIRVKYVIITIIGVNILNKRKGRYFMGITNQKIVTEDTGCCRQFFYELRNDGQKDVFIDNYVMFEADSLEALGLEGADCRVFRSGRHKNDMPSVFTLGHKNGAMEDALGGMSETGDKLDGDSKTVVISDHLTIIGNPGHYLVITYPEGHRQMFETLIYLDEEGYFKKLICRVNLQIRMTPGRKIQTEALRLEYTGDVEKTIGKFAENKAKLYRARTPKAPSVFCTWYYYGLTVTYEDVKTNLNIMKEKKLPFDVFQVDEGWEITLGEWKPNHKFPVPMKQVAEEIREAGYRPGIWTSPFIAHESATIWQTHPEWMLKDKNGNPCLFPMNDTVYQVLDITNPETWDYFRELYRMLTFDWGYTYHKLDFTRASVCMENAVYFDDTITLVEAYIKAVSAIREGMGEESYFLMCGGLYDPIVGLVDAQRTGSDVLSMWSSTINKNGKAAPYTVKQSVLRYYMNTWWNNDPDALMIRKNEIMERDLRLTYGLLNEEEVKTCTINQYMSGGLMCSTEPLDKIDEERLSNLKRILPVVSTRVEPMDFMDVKERYPENIKVDLQSQDITSLVRINWSDEKDMEPDFILESDMLPGYRNGDEDRRRALLGMEYAVCDYYTGEYRIGVKPGDKVTLPAIKPHGATVIKIQPVSNQPVIVKSTGHFSMGGEDIAMELKDSVLEIAYENPFGWEISYTVMLPEGTLTEQGERFIELKVAPFEKINKQWRCQNGI